MQTAHVEQQDINPGAQQPALGKERFLEGIPPRTGPKGRSCETKSKRGRRDQGGTAGDQTAAKGGQEGAGEELLCAPGQEGQQQVKLVNVVRRLPSRLLCESKGAGQKAEWDILRVKAGSLLKNDLHFFSDS